MKAKAWKGGGYGLRVGKPNARRYFHRHWSDIDVTIAGHTHTFPLSKTFWTTCPEFRSSAVETWLRSLKLVPWSYGKPPQVTLTAIGGRRFSLTYP